MLQSIRRLYTASLCAIASLPLLAEDVASLHAQIAQLKTQLRQQQQELAQHAQALRLLQCQPHRSKRSLPGSSRARLRARRPWRA